MSHSCQQQQATIRHWDELGRPEQTRLLIDFGHYQDKLQATCDIETKNRRFSGWLAQHAIQYP